MMDVVYSVAEFLDNCLGVFPGVIGYSYEVVAACIMVVSRFQIPTFSSTGV